MFIAHTLSEISLLHVYSVHDEKEAKWTHKAGRSFQWYAEQKICLKFHILYVVNWQWKNTFKKTHYNQILICNHCKIYTIKMKYVTKLMASRNHVITLMQKTCVKVHFNMTLVKKLTNNHNPIVQRMLRLNLNIARNSSIGSHDL